MAPTKEQKARVRNWLAKYRSKLFLQDWFIECDYQKENEKSDTHTLVASNNCDHIYLTAKIKIYPAFWERTLWCQEETIIHELCHCLTQGAWDAIKASQDGLLITGNQSRDIMELLTQKICVVVMNYETKEETVAKKGQKSKGPKKPFPKKK